MKCDPIFCSGNDLKSVLDGIEDRKGVVTDLHTGIGGNSGYKVNYFIGSVAVKAGAGSSRTPLRQLTACEGENPSTPDPFPQQGETPASPVAQDAVKGAVAPRNPMYDPESLVKGQPRSQGDGAEKVAVDPSISSRLATLQAKLLAQGKIKRTKPREARLPYVQD